MTGNRQHANPRSKGWTAFLVVLTLTSRSRDMAAAAKTHVIAFGKASSVPWPAGSGDHKPVPLKVRPLIVDGHVNEYVVGWPHEVTDRLFAVRRAFPIMTVFLRPGQPQMAVGARWLVTVTRTSSHISAINLPEFDNFYSAASWFPPLVGSRMTARTCTRSSLKSDGGTQF